MSKLIFQMASSKSWILAARLRTLPLSISGIILGSSLGFEGAIWQSSIFWLAILTTIGFQILSNFANDYGDGIRGTDNHREGEQRLVASGIITPKQMKRGILVTIVITLLIAIFLIYQSFGREDFLNSLLFFGLGIASIIAAIKYTVGKNAYGYSGMGDVFVFLFFGLLSVLGSYFLFSKSLSWDLLLPATTMGLFSVAVLNLNNMRDIENDKKHSKNTLVVFLGTSKAKIYHYTILIIAMLCAVMFALLNKYSSMNYVFLIAFIPMLLNIKTVYLNKEPKQLDSELKKVALSTFLFAILFSMIN